MEVTPPKINMPTPDNTPAEPESKSIFARIFKRREAEAQQEAEAQARPSRVRLLARAALRTVRGREKPTLELAEQTPQPPQPEQQEQTTSPEQPPVVERVRKLSRAVLTFAAEALTDLRRTAPKEQMPNEVERETAPLADAAEDLQHALDDLNLAAQETTEPKRAAFSQPEPESFGGGDGNNYFFERQTPKERPFAEQFEVVAAAERMQRVLEVKKDHAERGKEIVGRAFAATALGILGVGAVLIIGHQYRKAARERRELRASQKKTDQIIRSQERKMHTLEQAQVVELRPPAREQFIATATQITREQAGVTHEVAQQIRYDKVEQPVQQSVSVEQSVPSAVVFGPHESYRPQPTQIEARKTERPEWLRPLMQVEKGDQTEQLQPDTHNTSQNIAGGGQVTGRDNALTQQTSSLQGDNDKILPTKEVQPTLTYSAGTWFYGVLLIIAFIMVLGIIATLFR